MTTVFPSTPRLRLGVGVSLAALAVLAYLPAQLLPLIADDYVQINLGRRYGPSSSWSDLTADALYRCRATSILLTYWTEKLFGFLPATFKGTSLLLHVLNTLLVAATGLWRPIGWRLSLLAAAVFAVLEGHQEAVIWYAALPELLVFTFILAAFLSWVLWLERGCLWYQAASLLFFVAALFSKESAVCLIGLQVLAVTTHQGRKLRHWLAIVPFAALAAAYFALAYFAKSSHLHFNDGTFSLTASFWVTLPVSISRMLWIWGVVAFLILAACRRLSFRFLLILAAWAVITLLPYSFLTYMPRVPSRHTYLASVALAWIAGAGILAVHERWRGQPQFAVALCIALVLHNYGYLWTRKHQQYVERAAPTRDLLQFSRTHSGPIYVKCFPYAPEVAELALRFEAREEKSRLRWMNPPTCTGHAFEAVERLPAGQLVSIPSSSP